MGVIQSGAYADLLIVDGNPAERPDCAGGFRKNLTLIVKDGKIYTNTLK